MKKANVFTSHVFYARNCNYGAMLCLLSDPSASQTTQVTIPKDVRIFFIVYYLSEIFNYNSIKSNVSLFIICNKKSMSTVPFPTVWRPLDFGLQNCICSVTLQMKDKI